MQRGSIAVVCALSAFGCSSSSEVVSAGATGAGAASSSSTTTSSAGAGGAGGGAQASVHFFVNDRPQDPNNKEVEASEARWGDPIRIVVDGVGATKHVRLDISTSAWAVFTPDAAGTVDVGRDTPTSGTWPHADEDGPIWSGMPAQKPIFDIVVKASDGDSGAALAQGTLHRRPLNDGVDTTMVNSGHEVGMRWA